MHGDLKPNMEKTGPLMSVLAEIERRRFFGSLEIKFEAGRVTLIRKTETIKPAAESRRDNRGRQNGPDQNEGQTRS